MDNKVTLIDEHAKIVQVERYAMQPMDVKHQIALIQQLMKNVMKEGTHYGRIPGCGDRPTLLQAGAEKIMLTFRLRAEFEVQDKTENDRFLTYTIMCRLYHIPTNQFMGSGIGSCNSKESRYRYRNVSSGEPVPKEFWSARNRGDTQEMQNILGGQYRSVIKQHGAWFISDRVEHDNPWDYQNTLIKMAAKRAKVAAVLNATAASDIFTQDVEDLPRSFFANSESGEEPGEKSQEGQSPSGSDIKTSTSNKKEPPTGKVEYVAAIMDKCAKYCEGDVEAMNSYYEQFLHGKSLKDADLKTLKIIHADLEASLRQTKLFT